MNSSRLINIVETATKLRKPYFDLRNLTYRKIREFYEQMNYPFFTEKKDFNINIGAIRSADLTVNVYNDITFIAWEFNGKQNLHIFQATTDPGLYYLLKPLNINGTAIIIPDYYRGVFQLGIHQPNTAFRHEALRQIKPMRYWREKNYQKDSQLPLSHTKEFTEIAHTNLHSKPKHMAYTKEIGKISAGCVVNANPLEHHDVFIPICREAVKNFGNSFSFALFYEPNLLI